MGLSQEMLEKQENQVKIKNFDDETITSFLQYIYAARIDDEETVKTIRAQVGTDKHIFRRPGFQRTKYNIDLMRMAHHYEVKDLVTDCAEHLKDSICDENVMKVWTEAEKFEITALCSKSMEHLADRPVGKPLKEVPGFEEAFKDLDKPVKELLAVMSDKISSLKDEYQHLEDGKIKITIKSTNSNSNTKETTVYVKKNDKVSSFLQE